MFLNRFYFLAALGLQQNSVEGTKIFHLLLLPHMHYQYPSSEWYLLQLINLHWRQTLTIFYRLVGMLCRLCEESSEAKLEGIRRVRSYCRGLGEGWQWLWQWFYRRQREINEEVESMGLDDRSETWGEEQQQSKVTVKFGHLQTGKNKERVSMFCFVLFCGKDSVGPRIMLDLLSL